MGRRYNALREEGLSGDEAAQQVNQQFGTDLKTSTIRGYGTRAKKASEDTDVRADVPPSEISEPESDKTVEQCITLKEEPARFDVKHRNTVQEEPVNNVLQSLTDDAFIRKGKDILAEITKEMENKPYEWTGSRAKREKTHKTSPLAARIPEEIVNELKGLAGKTTEHIEKALRLYLWVIKS